MKDKITQEFQKLKNDIKPRPEWLASSRNVLLQRINPESQYQAVKLGFGGYLNVVFQTMNQRLVFEPAVIMLLVLGVFLGSSLTINAAFYSMPGETLYPVKIALERAHVALVPGEGPKVELKIEFAQKRMAELDKIISQVNVDPEKKKKNIEAAVKEFKNNVVAVNDHLNKMKDPDQVFEDKDKEKNLQIAIIISSKAGELAKTADEKVEGLSDMEKLEVGGIFEDAIQSAQEISISAQQLVEESTVAEDAVEAEGVEESGIKQDSIDGEEIKEEGTVEGAETEELLETSTIKEESVEEITE